MRYSCDTQGCSPTKVSCNRRLQEVRGRKAVVVLLVDLLDASGTLMAKVRWALDSLSGTQCVC